MSERVTPKLVKILLAIRDGLRRELGEYFEDRVVIAQPPSGLTRGEWTCYLWPRGETVRRSDGRLDRTVEIFVAAVMGVDPASPQPEAIQTIERYAAIQAAMERLVEGDEDLTGLVSTTITETDTEAAGLDDYDGLVYMATAWRVTYKRPPGRVDDPPPPAEE